MPATSCPRSASATGSTGAETTRYWAMAPGVGAFEPTDEIDAVRWVRLERLDVHLTNPRELLVVEGLRLVAASAA